MDAVRFAVAVAAIALALATPGWAEAGNLLENPGFETGDFTGWTVGGETAYTHVVSYEPSRRIPDLSSDQFSRRVGG